MEKRPGRPRKYEEKIINFDYSKIAEKVYSRSFFAVCIYIFLSIIMLWSSGENLIKTLEMILSFIERILWIFAVPVSLQIAGDKLEKVLPFIMKKK